MHSKVKDIPLTAQAGAFWNRGAEWGDFTMEVKGLPAGQDSRPALKGLPGDSCECPHWGYVFKGKLRVIYADHEEVVTADEAYFLPPGHNFVAEEDCELIMFSPKEELKKVVEAIAHKMKPSS